MRSLIDKLVDQIKIYQNFLIIIHQSPDGDAIGSGVALSLALEQLGKKATLVCADYIPITFNFLAQKHPISYDFFLGDWQVVFVLDCGDLKRTGFPARIKQFAKSKKKLINIDHHPKNDLHKIANITLADQKSSSTGEILVRIFDLLGVKYTSEIATSLLTAIYTDTGGFKHSNTTQATLNIASRLLGQGARLGKITKNISYSKTLRSLKLWGIALQRIRNHQDIGLVSSFITREDIKKVAATQDDLAGVVNMICSVPGAKAAILLTELESGEIKGSIRTESEKVDTAKIAAILGGGGHKKASGFTINGRLFKDKHGWRII